MKYVFSAVERVSMSFATSCLLKHENDVRVSLPNKSDSSILIIALTEKDNIYGVCRLGIRVDGLSSWQ